ncbi:hypothetical protein ACE6H2_007025 [Prunus campanulata]
MANQVKQGGAEWQLMVNSKVELNEILYFFSFPSKFLIFNIITIISSLKRLTTCNSWSIFSMKILM